MPHILIPVIFQEDLRQQDFPLDWRLSGSGDKSMIGYANLTCKENKLEAAKAINIIAKATTATYYIG